MPYDKDGNLYYSSDRQAIHRGLFWVGVLVVVASALSLVGWRAGWWFAQENANRGAHVIRQGYSNQQTLREQITKNIGDVSTITVQITQVGDSDQAESAALKAQRKAIVNIVCQNAEQVTGDPLPADQSTWVGQNCLNGSISPNSAFYAS